MKLLKYMKTIIDGFILRKVFKNSFGNAQGFADSINNDNQQYWNMKIINVNKYLTRSVNGVLWLFNYDKIYDTPIPYSKNLSWASDKRKFMSICSDFDYEDYKKIIFYDDLYDIYTKQYLYWYVPDGIDTYNEIKQFVKQVESFQAISLQDIKKKFQ